MNEYEQVTDPSGRVVVLAPDLAPGDAIRLIDVVKIAWNGRYHIIGCVVAATTVAIVYALLATEWYRADVLLIPNEESVPGIPGNLGGLSNLAGFAGISFSGGSSEESIAVLRSRDFVREFIADEGLMPVIFADAWDEDASAWIEDEPVRQPDIRDGVDYFDENILQVSQDVRTQLVTLEVRWTDPERAALWASKLVDRVNNRMRLRAIETAQQNIDYLQAELAKTNIAALRSSIGNLLQSELQKSMLASGNTEFAFRTIDSAQVPRLRIWPRRSLIAVLGVVAGGFLGLLWVFVSHASRQISRNATDD